MKTMSTSVSVVLLALTVCASIAAGASMGPPIALLGEGKWSFGGEYAHSVMDLESCGTFQSIYVAEPTEVYTFIEEQEIEDLTQNMFFATVAYGVCDNWDVFMRFGGSDLKADLTATSDVGGDGILGEYSPDDLDCSYGFAWGVGTRATFCRSGPWSFGGLMQVTWFSPSDSDVAYVDPVIPSVEPAITQVGTASIDFWQTQASVAVAYEAGPVRLWAGPFLQFIDGELDRDGYIALDSVATASRFEARSDIRQESWLGGHFGANWDIADQWNLWFEGQITGDSWLLGIGAAFTPETFNL